MLGMSASNLTRSKVRTILSVLAITIGVASLIALVSVVDGIRFQVENALSKAQGARVIAVNATEPVFSSLDESWTEKIEKVQGVKVAIPNIIQIAKSVEGKPIAFNGTRIVGVSISKLSQATGSGFSGELLEGRDFRVSDEGKNLALIGKKVKDDHRKFLGSNIEFNGEDFTIIGVYSTGSELLDNSALIPIDKARDITGFAKDKVSYLNVQLNNPSQDKEVVQRIKLIYGEEVRASTLSDFSDQFSQLFDSVTLLVALIASIASIVAAVGIINTMLMSVLERFREIGALKATGWTRGNIVQMVLYEAFFIGLIGAACGVAVGYLASRFIAGFGLTTVLTPELLLGSFLGAIIVSILAGLYPAFIASRMDPVEALRAE